MRVHFPPFASDLLQATKHLTQMDGSYDLFPDHLTPPPQPERTQCRRVGVSAYRRRYAHTPIPRHAFSLCYVSSAMKPILSLFLLLFAVTLHAQDPDADGKIMLTVILRHDQSKTLDEINDHLEKTGFRKDFPPEGVEIVSYNIVMGIGHIITLRLPSDKLREVNLAFEHGVWGAFRTEFYPTYDYLKVFYDLKQKDIGSNTAKPAEQESGSEKKPADSEKASPAKKAQKKGS
jgi:hypothetical protein